MKCSITHGRIKLFMPGRADFTIPETEDRPTKDYTELRLKNRADLLRSALQRPELSRAHLAYLLRKALKKQESEKAQRTYWSAFLAGCIGKNANSNDLGS